MSPRRPRTARAPSWAGGGWAGSDSEEDLAHDGNAVLGTQPDAVPGDIPTDMSGAVSGDTPGAVPDAKPVLDDDVREPLLIHEDECLPNKAIRNHRRESVVRCGSQGLSCPKGDRN